MYLFTGSLNNDLDAGWKAGKSHLQHTVMCDAVLLKAVEEGCWRFYHLRLLDDHDTLEVRIHTRWFQMGSNGNVSVVASAFLWIINLVEPLVEKVIEAFVDIICLGHDYCVTFNGRMTNRSNCIDLGREGQPFINKYPKISNKAT